MSVWLTIPSARPAEETGPRFKLWRERGYKIAVQVDTEQLHDSIRSQVDFAMWGPYDGYAKAVNHLISILLSRHPDADWFIPAGDDIDPDPNHTAEEIAEDCRVYFSEYWSDQLCKDPHPTSPLTREKAETFGVMQPTGDRWGSEEPWAKGRWPGKPAYIDRICGSAFIGREFCRRMYQGQGPLWPGWFHMRVDEELKCVAESMGVLWQRRDLIHYHHHAQRQQGPTPAFLEKAYSQAHWCESTALFEKRKAQGFPGREPID